MCVHDDNEGCNNNHDGNDGNFDENAYKTNCETQLLTDQKLSSPIFTCCLVGCPDR